MGVFTTRNSQNSIATFSQNGAEKACDWAKNVISRVFTSFFHSTMLCNSHIKETNVLTKFHEHWAKNVTSRVFTCFHYVHIKKNALSTASHINKTNVLTNFHDDWAKIVTSRVFARKTAPPTGGHVFQRTGTTF
ncbi:hypothetical protein DPMN_080479 [Dreissena polymorpha]|uniref:Uncharacterized protein n=1 Tax=Dreissena polymorpha TaxID=45954 RepID=A0A9D4BRT6_DREPO|nr:hypothetical protein DPMN_080479 [Dreissena polymorpha]